LNGAEDIGNIGLHLLELDLEYGAPGMQDDVNRRGEQGGIGSYGGAEPALDPVAVVRFAHNLADSEADAWTCTLIFAGREEVSHLPRVLLAAAAVHALKVGVFAKAEIGVH
jgi:hypothetical protein